MSLSVFSRESFDEREFVEEWVRGYIHLFEVNPPEIEQKRSRKRGPRIDYRQTAWWGMLQDPEVQNPLSKVGKLFRLRFRAPWDLYHNELLPMVRAANIFPERQIRKVRVPLEIKILFCLRRLGRGLVADDVVELANAAASSWEAIFHQFVEGMVNHYFTIWVKVHEGEDQVKCLQVYLMLGFPGCLGSGDATHVLWDRSPASLFNQMKGKEGAPQ